MSIKSAFESEGINFSEYMNAPEPWNGQALIRNINGTKYVCCPFCQKKALLISPETKIQHLKLKCKGSNCKKEFEVNVCRLVMIVRAQKLKPMVVADFLFAEFLQSIFAFRSSGL